MFGHVVARFANDDSVAGYDVMNEPNVLVLGQDVLLSEFYEQALAEMRAAEAEVEVGAPETSMFFFASQASATAGMRSGARSGPAFCSATVRAR